jgi:hypothetical protein
MADLGDEPGVRVVYPTSGHSNSEDPDDTEFADALQVENVTNRGARAVETDLLQREHEEETAEVLRTMRELDTGDGIYWRISRIGHQDPAMNGHMETWPDARVTLDNIKDEFGGGIYRCKGFRSTGGYAGHKTVRIAGDAVRKAKSVDGAASNSGFDVQGFLAQMEARDERRRREEREFQERRDAQREKYILALGPAALAAVASIFGGNRGGDVAALAAAMRPAPGPDPLAMIAALKQLAPEAPRGPGPMEQALHLFEVLSDKAGAGQGRTEWLDVVKEGVKMFGPSVGGAIEATITQARANAQNQQNTQNQGQPVGNGIVGVHPAGAAQALPAPQTDPGAAHGSSGDPAMLDLLDLAPHVPWLREQLTKMSSAAQRNRDPELYAAMFLEELPQGLTAQRVLELLSRSDWLPLLARFNAQIAQQGPWWTRTRDCIVGYIHEAAAPSRVVTGEIERPQSLPSLIGDQ